MCVGEPQTTLRCSAPAVEGTWTATPGLMDTPLVLELTTGDRVNRFTFPVTLSTLTWKTEALADGSLRLTCQPEPTLTEALIVRTETPDGRWNAALERRSATELILPGAASWAPATLELTTSLAVQAQLYLTIEAHQVVAL